MNTHQLIHLAAEAGKIILENGGETYRVEDTILRLCNAFGVKNAESFVTPTVIMISITDDEGSTTSIIKRIRNRTIDLDKISRINELSRAAGKNLLTPEYFEKELNQIQGTSRYSHLITIIFSALAAGFFTLLFGGNYFDFVVSMFIGILIKSFSTLLKKIDINDFFINTFGGAVSALIALISVRAGIAQNIDKIIIGSIMLLVPGLAITNAIRDTLSGDLVAGVARAVEALFVAVAVAAGSGIIIKFWISSYGAASIPAMGSFSPDHSGFNAIVVFGIYSLMCALGFGIIFNIRGKRLFFAALGGGIGWSTYLCFLSFNVSATMSLFAASLAVGIYAEIMARLLHSPVTTFIVSAIIPLVPGGGMFYTMLESIQGNVAFSLQLGTETLLSAGAIAVSIVLATSISRIISFFLKLRINHGT